MDRKRSNRELFETIEDALDEYWLAVPYSRFSMNELAHLVFERLCKERFINEEIDELGYELADDTNLPASPSRRSL